MARNTWNLEDDLGVAPKFRLSTNDVSGTPPGWSVVRRVLHGGVSEGVDLLEIDNGRIKIVAVPTRGMGIWYAEQHGTRLGWHSPVKGPVHPHFVPITEPSGVGWLDGFDELMVRCGLENNGSAVFNDRGQLVFPLHGRIANKPAHSLSVTIDNAAGLIEVSAVVDEVRFHFQKLRLRTTLTTSFESTTFGWTDEVENFGGNVATMQMLYHVNIGQPLLAPGARLLAPVRTVTPHDKYDGALLTRDYQTYPDLSTVVGQQSYFFDLLSNGDGNTQVMLANPSGENAVVLRFNKGELPCFSQWRNNVEACDGYVTALEPGTNFPNPRTFEEQHGRVVKLLPGQKWRATVMLDWHTDRQHVQEATRAIEDLQGDVQPVIYDLPKPDYSPRALP